MTAYRILRSHDERRKLFPAKGTSASVQRGPNFPARRRLARRGGSAVRLHWHSNEWETLPRRMATGTRASRFLKESDASDLRCWRGGICEPLQRVHVEVSKMRSRLQCRRKLLEYRFSGTIPCGSKRDSSGACGVSASAATIRRMRQAYGVQHVSHSSFGSCHRLRVSS
jgi:hypothetical protein